MIARLLKVLLIPTVICVVFSSPGLTQAAPAPVPETGQTVSYQAGDDGALRPGVTWPTPRFTDNGNGTVADNLTGLVWLKNANCFDVKTWSDAITASNGLASGACGLSDGSTAGQWRLPNADQLSSLADFSHAGLGGSAFNALPAGHPFSDVKADYYWSSSTLTYSSTVYAWTVRMDDGSMDGWGKGANKFVWPVRAAQTGPIAPLALSPASKNFGAITTNTASPSQTFTLTNNGSANLTVSGFNLLNGQPGEFSISMGSGSGGSCGPAPTLAPGGNCTIGVTFNPTTAGNKETVLHIYSNDPVNPDKIAALNGTGVLPSYSVTPSAGVNGSISPDTLQTVTSGETATFTITPNSNYSVVTPIGGTCPQGTLTGNSYTTGAITADCTVAPTFADAQKPTVTGFTLPATATTLTVAVSTLTATDNVGVTGYIITESSTAPTAVATGWSATAPTSYAFASIPDGIATAKTLFAWAKDAAGNVSTGTTTTTTITLPDITKPVVSAFTVPATATTLTVAVSTFTATDNVGVTGYMITESPTAPTAVVTGWSATSPTSYTFASIPDGVPTEKTLYAWAKDEAGNVSTSATATTTITLPDVTKPVVTAFTIPATVTSLTIAVSTFTATDNVAVTGYMLTESTTSPLATDSGWSATAPATFTFSSRGAKNLYAWAKDAAGNVSDSTPATTTILPQYTLNAALTGRGSVSAQSGIINCGSVCNALADYGTEVTLTATPAENWSFVNWSGACTGTGDCALTVNENKNVIANFERKIYAEGTWVVTLAGDTGPSASPVDVSIGGTYIDSSSEIKISNLVSQLFSVKGNGYLRSIPLGGEWGTSFVSTGFWRDGSASPVHGLKVKDLDLTFVNSRLVLRGKAVDNVADPGVETTDYTIALDPPTASRTEAEVSYTLKAVKPLALDAVRQANHEGFRIAQFSSMYLDSTNHDADAAVYVDATETRQQAQLLNSNTWIFPSTATLGGDGILLLQHSDKQPRNTPAQMIQVIEPPQSACTPQGWVQSTTDSNDDNVGGWINWDGAPSTVAAGGMIGAFRYRLSAVTPQTSAIAGPNAVPFGTVEVGSTSMKTVRVTNHGSSDLVIDHLSLTGSAVLDYSLSNDTCTGATLASLTGCTTDVTFSPASTGAKSVNLVVSSNDPAAPNYDISVSGSGVDGVDVSPPLVTAFNLPVSSSTLSVVVSAFTATDNSGVSGYLITESATPPLATDSNWSATPPSSYTFASIPDGVPTAKTLYAWAKDAAGNVSNSLSANITITLPVNGVCGSSNGGVFATAPSTNLCTTGTASAVTGTGPWSWSCNGSSGGTNASCSANLYIPPVPGAPTIGTATAGNASASVTFSPPSSDGGSPITGYTATSTPGSITANGTTSPITVTGLTNGTAYTFTVKATNAVGTGPASAASNSVTPSPTTYTVTPSAGANGSISPSTAVSVSSGDTTTFTLLPDDGYRPNSVVTGTCPAGSFTGLTYTTGAVTTTCTVIFSFETIPQNSVVINGGNLYTNSKIVTLALSAAPIPAYMSFQVNGKTWTKPEAFSASKTITLPAANGLRTVSVHYLASLTDTSPALCSSTITLDTKKPKGKILINNGAKTTYTTSVTLNITATDAYGDSQMQFSTDKMSWSNWEAYSTTKSFELTHGTGTKRVYVRFQDLAGNISAIYSDSIKLME